MLLFTMVKIINTTRIVPSYSLLYAERAALSAVITKESYCNIFSDSIDRKCVGIYREGLKEGTVVGYKIKVEDITTGKKIKEFEDGKTGENIFILSRYIIDNSTLYKVSLEVYTE